MMRSDEHACIICAKAADGTVATQHDGGLYHPPMCRRCRAEDAAGGQAFSLHRFKPAFISWLTKKHQQAYQRRLAQQDAIRGGGPIYRAPRRRPTLGIDF